MVYISSAKREEKNHKRVLRECLFGLESWISAWPRSTDTKKQAILESSTECAVLSLERACDFYRLAARRRCTLLSNPLRILRIANIIHQGKAETSYPFAASRMVSRRFRNKAEPSSVERFTAG